jgi:hypothetical protein
MKFAQKVDVFITSQSLWKQPFWHTLYVGLYIAIIVLISSTVLCLFKSSVGIEKYLAFLELYFVICFMLLPTACLSALCWGRLLNSKLNQVIASLIFSFSSTSIFILLSQIVVLKLHEKSLSSFDIMMFYIIFSSFSLIAYLKVVYSKVT